MQITEIGGRYIVPPEDTLQDPKNMVSVYDEATGIYKDIDYLLASTIAWENFGGGKTVTRDSIEELLFVELQVAYRRLEIRLENLMNSGERNDLKEKLKQGTSRLGLLIDAQDLSDPKGNAAASEYFQEKQEEFSRDFFYYSRSRQDPPRLSPDASLLEIGKYQNRQESQANNLLHTNSLTRKLLRAVQL